MEENDSSCKQNNPPSCGTLVTILSLDGGGIRGVISGVILAYLEQQLQVYIYISIYISVERKLLDTNDRNRNSY